MSSLPSHVMSVVEQNIAQLKPYSNNARTHSKQQIRQIADSIKAWGFTNPILTDKQNTIIAGHGRWRAAQLLGMTRVPTICLENLTEDQVRAYILADNKLAEKAGWNESILAIELQYQALPNSLLARYFQGRRLFADLNFAAMKETQPDALFAAWLSTRTGRKNPRLVATQRE